MIFTEEEILNEEWRDVIGYDYLYQVSNLGRFKKVSSYQNKFNGRITTGSIDAYGYVRVSLIKQGKSVGKKVHRLVAEFFIDGFKGSLTVNHKDFNKLNNRLINLELMTAYENTLDFITKVKKPNSSSPHLGVNFHKQTCKWVARITVNKERLPLGSFDTEEEAINAIERYKNGELVPIIGKGKSNKGRRKFTYEQMEYAVKLSYSIGVPKASKETGIGTTTISTLRKEWKNKLMN